MSERGGPVVAVLVLAALLAPLAAAQGGGFEWPDGRYNPFGHSPILIVLDLSNLTEESDGYRSSVQSAMRYWERGGNGRLQWEVRFEETTDRERADIVLWLRDASRVGPTCEEAEHALGCARPFERPVPIEVVLRLQDGAFRSFQQVREVTEHELGHALGLPHSSDPNDIMGPNASLRAASSWRPGDLPRLLWGLGLLLVALAGSVWALRRALRPQVDIGAVTRMTSDVCPATRGPHELSPSRIMTAQGEQDWLVCLACRQGRPVE